MTSTANKCHHRKSPLSQGGITEESSYRYISSAKALWGTSGIKLRFVIDFHRNTLLQKKNQTTPLLSMSLIYGTGCTVFSGASQVHNLCFTLTPLCEFIGCQKLSIRVMELCLPFGGYDIFFYRSVQLFLHRCHMGGSVPACHWCKVIFFESGRIHQTSASTFMDGDIWLNRCLSGKVIIWLAAY